MAVILNIDPSLGINTELKQFFRSKIGKNFEKKLNRPSISLDKDFFALIFHKRIVGCALVEPEPEIERIILNVYVFPDFRKKGYGSLLLKEAVERGKNLKVGKIHVNVYAHNIAAREFLTKHSFKRVRCFLDMRMELDKVQMLGFLPNEISVSNMDFGQERKLAEIQNQIFKRTWGFCPNSVQDIKYYMNLIGSKIQDVLWLEKDSSPFGYFWSHAISDLSKRGEVRKRARIHMCGLEKNFRSKGKGKLLMLSGLNYLKKQNIDLVVLTVDSLNTPAVSLYRDFGFRTIGRKYWYERLLNNS